MYYKGTQAECKAYDREVTQGEGYDGVYTMNWANPIEHPNGVDFAIIKHEDYSADMIEISQLSRDWFSNIEE